MRLPRLITATLSTSVLLLTGLTGCAKSSPTAVPDVVIGLDYDDASPVDLAYLHAMQLRIDELNASGQLGAHRLRLDALVSHSDPATTQRDLTRLAADHSVAGAIVGACGECAAAAARTIDDQGLPTISLSAADAVTQPVASHKFVFKLGPDGSAAATLLVNELKQRQESVVGVLAGSDLAGQDNLRDLRTAMTRAGLAPTVVRDVQPDAMDLDTPVGALTTAKLQALVVLADPYQSLLAAKSARAAGFRGSIYFGATAAGDLFLPAEDSGAVNGTEMVFTEALAIDDVIATNPAKVAAEQWFRDFTSKYGTYSGIAASAADADDLIADAAVKANGDRNAIRDILETTQTQGLSGAIRMTANNHSGLSAQAMTLLIARSGRWRLVS